MNDLATGMHFRKETCLLLTALFFLFTYVFLQNSWVGDDAYITFRAVDNFTHGYGLRWNVIERVQVFTCPLWALLVSALVFVTSEYYYTVLSFSFVLCLGSFLYYWHRRRDAAAFLVLVLTLLSSKAFTDYTSSGLESPLSFLFLFIFYMGFLNLDSGPVTSRHLFLSSLISSLAFTTRPDTVILYLIPLAYLGLRAYRQERFKVLIPLALGGLPAVAWEIFAILYYGFPFPNSYYAKLDLGISSAVLLRQGLGYLVNSFLFDPVTLSVLAISLVYACANRRIAPVLAVASAVFYVLYTVKIGGDFMSGRFLALPFLVSILVLSFMDFRRKTLLTVCALVITYNILHPWAPIKSDAEKPWDHPYIYHRNVYDEAGGYRRGTNLLHFFPFSGDRPSETFPKCSQYEAWARFGRLLKEKESPLAVPLGGGMGYLGFFAGPGPFIIDGFAITDPFLARLVVPEAASLDYQPGHVKRYIPQGYIESIITGENMIEDPELKEYYRKLAIITRGELFNRERMRYVLEFNLGGMKRFDRVPSPLANLPESGFLHWP